MAELSDLEYPTNDYLAGNGMRRPDGYPKCWFGWDMGRGKFMVNARAAPNAGWKMTVTVSAVLRYCAKRLVAPNLTPYSSLVGTTSPSLVGPTSTTCVDDDVCLQNKPDWGSSYTCANSVGYCET